MAIDKRYKFYLIIRIADFQTWKLAHPTAWANWKDRFLEGFDLNNARLSTNLNYAILENCLSYFDTRSKAEEFETAVGTEVWVEMFPLILSIQWTNYGYTINIKDQLKLNPTLWGLDFTP